MKKVFVFFVILILSLVSAAIAVDVMALGRSNSLVNDYAGVLSPGTKVYLEKLLHDIRGNNFTGTEIEVTTLKTLNAIPLESFMQEYVKRWRRPFLLENDNRVHIILILSENKFRMGIGRYLQHMLTQQDAKNIAESVIFPEFKYGNYDAGIKKGIEAIINILNKSKLPKNYTFVFFKYLFRLTILVIAAFTAIFLIRRKR